MKTISFQLQQHFIFITSVQLSDWINSLNLYENDPNSFCCLTSHSVALKCSILWEASNQASIGISKKLLCPDKSTLYSSLIRGTTWSTTIIFGGTALGDIFIWKEIDDEAIVLHRLTGHNVNSIKFICVVRIWNKILVDVP